LISGVAFKKTFSYAGFEQQPKKFENPKILLLNLELELKAEKDNAEVRVETSEEYKKIVDAEWNIIYEKLSNIANSGAQVILSRLAIGDLATQYFADRGLFCAGRVAEEVHFLYYAFTHFIVQKFSESRIQFSYSKQLLSTSRT
jgi:T-complex protein 1 subunit eta